MQNDPFIILGVSRTATQQEIKEAYEKLHQKYAQERFAEGEKGAEAARMYTKVELAYQDALEYVQNNATVSDAETENKDGDYEAVRDALKRGDISGAQKILDDMVGRGGEWHFWQAAVYYKKNWYDESRTQLKIALELEPNNQKFKDALAKLEKEQSANNPFGDKKAQESNFERTYSSQQGQPNAGACCDCCGTLICADCCCEMCGGDLISCC